MGETKCNVDWEGPSRFSFIDTWDTIFEMIVYRVVIELYWYVKDMQVEVLDDYHYDNNKLKNETKMYFYKKKLMLKSDLRKISKGYPYHEIF